ncbi:tRNA (guanine(46)-N(7))-methyltransferase TrmB [Thauera linaloolentis]|uniref:tRNA (guanine(46)-N(7))-methyltransferase n=1 Tax=Thauera linaloolentis (strain DSM 12138 / JCM 21573 / CCUG 41526 / CIP 105981 / IAM 15112 / NBRC 102519 / 47Lol) TaxID=1123367 RepID=N6Z0I8_THAL4|nr:methyltransferase domain-containing protein [Thauera linaloolentis]ENO88142.1 tRNA (guanine-N7-)-methyltransferase [Thauera linaloolentis 47Lol = DSM 12138]MCM8565834.1 methyltransferase domain-containing protein [Thauera linaloolentis]
MSYANSRIPQSAQCGVHERLEALVRKHLAEPFLKPVAPYNREALDLSLAGWDGEAPLILDAGCGVGHSTIQIARAYPGHWVIGVDQSQDRLARRKPYPDALMPRNLVFVRADLVDYWRLLDEAGLRLARHYILYPNPWPKIGHLARRWHAHPVFPFIARLGGILECRSNWDVYIREMAAALSLALGREVAWETFAAELPISPFERKYRDSGQALYRLEADLRDEAAAAAAADR